MHGVFGKSSTGAPQIGGHPRPDGPVADRIVRTLVGPVCKVIWPEKTDAQIAVICCCDPRNARRYLSGELPMPSVLLAAINSELVKRFE